MRLSDDEQVAFVGAMAFLESNWGCRVHYEIDAATGRGTIMVWMPGTQSVLFIDRVNARNVAVIERNPQRFPD